MAGAIETLERLVGRLNAVLLVFCKALAVLLLTVMTIIIVAAVFYRYVLNDAIAWSEEIAKFIMVWMAFITAPVGMKMGAHIAIEAIAGRLKGRIAWLLQAVIFVSVIALMAMFVKEGAFLTMNARIQRASTIDLSIFYVYLSMPVGCAIMGMVAFEQFLNALKGVFDPSRATAMSSDPTIVN